MRILEELDFPRVNGIVMGSTGAGRDAEKTVSR
jgi:hypothetical protein